MKFVGDPNYGALFYLILFIPGLAFILGVFLVLGSWVGIAALIFTPILVFFYCKVMNHGVFSLVEVSGGDIKFSSVDFITNKEKLKVCKVSDLTSVREKRYLFSLGLVLVFENHSNVFIKIETYRKSGKYIHLQPESMEQFLGGEIQSTHKGPPLDSTTWSSLHKDLFLNYFKKLC